MTDKIGSYGRPGVDVGQARAREVQKPERSGGPESGDRSEAARDAVTITDTAANLKRIEAGLADLPDTNRDRIAAVRERIDAGEYRVDADAIAKKLVRLEQDLT